MQTETSATKNEHAVFLFTPSPATEGLQVQAGTRIESLLVWEDIVLPVEGTQAPPLLLATGADCGRILTSFGYF